MDNLWNSPLSDILDRISSSEPVPGGGSASSISGAIGISLVLMSINVTRKSLPSDPLDLAAASFQQDTIDLRKLLEEDMKVFSQYMTALRLPKDTPELESIRKQALKEATINAIEVPISAAKLLSQSLSSTVEIAPQIKASVISDTFAGCELIKSAAIAILLNVDVNLQSKSITDRKAAYQTAKIDILVKIESDFCQIIEIANHHGFSFGSEV
jgi:methenyltetrahydrofolate cyclohydrolase